MSRARDREGRTIRGDTGQISSWLVKLVLIVGIVGFLVIEFGAVLVNQLQAGDVAGTAASEAGLVYVQSRDIKAAERRAIRVAEQNDTEFVEIRADDADGEIAVTVEKEARTFVIHRIDALAGMTVARATERAPLRR